MTQTREKKSSSSEDKTTKLSEQLRSIYTGQKFSTAVNSKFDMLTQDVDEEMLDSLVKHAIENDTELKMTLNFAKGLLGGHPETQNRKRSMLLIERVVSEFSLMASIKTQTIFQSWIHNNQTGGDNLSFIANQVSDLSVNDNSGTRQKLKPKQVASIIQIAAIWLYCRDNNYSQSLYKYLAKPPKEKSRSQSPKIKEQQIFLLGVDMINSNVRDNFALYLGQIDIEIKRFKEECERLDFDIKRLNNQLSVELDNVANLSSKLQAEQAQSHVLDVKIKALQNEIEQQSTRARHADIHHGNSKRDVTSKASHFLKGELTDLIDKALSANKKSKPEMVKYQLEDALNSIEKELKWLDA